MTATRKRFCHMRRSGRNFLGLSGSRSRNIRETFSAVSYLVYIGRWSEERHGKWREGKENLAEGETARGIKGRHEGETCREIYIYIYISQCKCPFFVPEACVREFSHRTTRPASGGILHQQRERKSGPVRKYIVHSLEIRIAAIPRSFIPLLEFLAFPIPLHPLFGGDKTFEIVSVARPRVKLFLHLSPRKS